MHRLLVTSALLLFALPSSAATKTTIEQLQTVLADLHQQNKSDEATANRLKELALTEQLTPDAAARLNQYHPGPLTSVQIRILADESALLLPPASELPSDAAPDRNTQTTIVNKTIDYVLHQNSQLPRLTAKKEITRFQSGGTAVRGNTGTYSSLAAGDPGDNSASQQYLQMLGTYTATVQSEKGMEIPPAATKKVDPTSQAGQFAQGGAGLVIALVLMDAGKKDLQFARWELVSGRKAAVFSFSVDKADSHYKVNYCCFPVIENIGGAGSINASPTVPSMMAQPGGTAATYKPFTANPGYHGEFFIDPDTGVIVRLTTSAELKPTDIVRHEDIRVDYGSVNVDGKPFVVPVKSITLTELSPNGDAFVKSFTRRTVFEANYKSYILADVPRAR